MPVAIDREPPAGYTCDDGNAYYLAPQANWEGATPLFMVMKDTPGETRILAESCYRSAGVEIVDALRAG